MGRLNRSFDIIVDSRTYRMLVRRRYTGCDRCPPHKGHDNAPRHYRKKKAFELDFKRKHRLT